MAKKHIVNIPVLLQPNGDPYTFQIDECQNGNCTHKMIYHNDSEECKYRGCECDMFIPAEDNTFSLAGWIEKIIGALPQNGTITSEEWYKAWKILDACAKAKDELVLDTPHYKFLHDLLTDDQMGKRLGGKRQGTNENVLEAAWGPSIFRFIAVAVTEALEDQIKVEGEEEEEEERPRGKLTEMVPKGKSNRRR